MIWASAPPADHEDTVRPVVQVTDLLFLPLIKYSFFASTSPRTPPSDVPGLRFAKKKKKIV